MPQITALSTLTYPDLSLGEALARIAARGFRAVDLAHMSVYCRHFALGEAATGKIRELLRANGLRPIALNYYGGGSDPLIPAAPSPHRLHIPDEATRYQVMMRQVIGQCRALSIPLLMAVPGRRSEAPDRRQELTASSAIISALADEAHASGVRLVVEAPHCFNLCHSVERLAEFFALVTSPYLGVTVDSSHWGVLRYDLEALWDAVGPRIWHVHLRDGAGPDTDDFRQQLELTPGTGDVDFACFGAWLDRHDYRNTVTMELEYRSRTAAEIDIEVDRAIIHLTATGWDLPPGVAVH